MSRIELESIIYRKVVLSPYLQLLLGSEARLARVLSVARGEGLEVDGGLVGHVPGLHGQTVVFVNRLASYNWNGKNRKLMKHSITFKGRGPISFRKLAVSHIRLLRIHKFNHPQIAWQVNE